MCIRDRASVVNAFTYQLEIYTTNRAYPAASFNLWIDGSIPMITNRGYVSHKGDAMGDQKL